MNLDECKAAVKSAIDDLAHGSGAAIFIARQKLQAALDAWPQSDVETQRLMKFEHDARAVLGHPYQIRPATWTNADGSEHLLRILDEDEVMKVLKG